METAEILSEFHAWKLRVDALNVNEDAATVLSRCKSKLEVNLKPLPENVRDILRQVPSMAKWGKVDVPEFTATCSLCGSSESFKLWDTEPYDPTRNCLEQDGWEADEVLCFDCKPNDDIEEQAEKVDDGG